MEDITEIILSGLDGIIGNREIALEQIRRSIVLQLGDEDITREEAVALRDIVRTKFMEALPDQGAPVGLGAVESVMSELQQAILSAHRNAGNRSAVGLTSLKKILTSKPPITEVSYVALKGYKGPSELYDFAIRCMNPIISAFIDTSGLYPFEFVSGDLDLLGTTTRTPDKKVVVEITNYSPKSRVAKMHLNRAALVRYRVSLDSIAIAITTKFDICVGIGSLADCNIYLYGGPTIGAFETYLMLNFRDIINTHVYIANVSSKSSKTNYGSKLATFHEYSEFTLKRIEVLPVFKMIVGNVLTLDVAYMQYAMISIRRIEDIFAHFDAELVRMNDFDYRIVGNQVSLDMLKTAPENIIYKHVIVLYGPPLGLYYILEQREVLKSETYCNNPQVMQVLFGIESAHMMQACSAREATDNSAVSSEDLKLCILYTSGCGKLVNVVDTIDEPLGDASRSETSRHIIRGAVEGREVDIPVLAVSVMFGGKPAISTYEVETANRGGAYISNTGLREVNGIDNARYHEVSD